MTYSNYKDPSFIVKIDCILEYYISILKVTSIFETQHIVSYLLHCYHIYSVHIETFESNLV